MIDGVKSLVGSSFNLVPRLEPGGEKKPSVAGDVDLSLRGRQAVAISEPLRDCFAPLAMTLFDPLQV